MPIFRFVVVIVVPVLWLSFFFAARALPDLIVNPDTFTPYITSKKFEPGDCNIKLGCISVPGVRRLLRFTTETRNIGKDPMVLGEPSLTNHYFTFSACKNRWQRADIQYSSLRTPSGKLVAQSNKVGYCLLDSFPFNGNFTRTGNGFGCDAQGLSPGWSDFYASSLDCQWVDITNVVDGSYILTVVINANRALPESNYTNNGASIGVIINNDVVTTFTPASLPFSTRLPVTVTPPPQNPNNSTPKKCPPATNLILGQFNKGTTVGKALGYPTPPVCGSFTFTESVSWFSVIGSGGFLTATTCFAATNFDTFLFVVTSSGNSTGKNTTNLCPSLSCLGVNDDAYPRCSVHPYASTLYFCTKPRVKYYIGVAGFKKQTGTFRIQLKQSSAEEKNIASMLGIKCPTP